MDVPISRVPQDPLQGPILEAEVNDVYRHAKVGREVILGPMPVRAFIDEFLPPALRGAPMPKCSGAFNRISLEPEDEGEVCNALCAAIDENGRCPSLNFCITTSSTDQHDPDILQPEILAYNRSFGPPAEGADPSDLTPKYRHRPGLGSAELFVLVHKNCDPFCESHTHDRLSKSIRKSFFAFENHRYQKQCDFDAGSEEKRNLGRAIGCISVACSRQYRVFYFSILIFGTRARFIRWDRAGGIVTVSFDYRRQPEPLCEFLWRFHHANPMQRGHDPSVTVASPAEESLFRTCVRRHAALQLALSETQHEELDEALQLHYESGKVMKMRIYDKCRGKTQHYYLVSVPLTSPRSADGRATRAYWAVAPTASDQGEVRFVKDVWRIEMPGVSQEGVTHVEMEEARVENICDLEAFGDISVYEPMTFSGRNMEDASVDVEVKDQYGQLDQACTPGHIETPQTTSSLEQDRDTIVGTVQSTRTNDYVHADWVCDCLRDNLSLRVRRHVHCRVVLKQAGYPLRTFKGSRELFRGAKDALEALDSAYKRCGRIHRDVSLDNIILYRDEPSQPRHGLLVDWEFSTVVDDTGKSSDGLYTGTWAFLSARILRHRDENYQTQEDDMESLFYVLMYGCLRWLPQQRTCELGEWLYDFFYEVREGKNGGDRGGTEKYIQQGSEGVDFLRTFKFENKHVHSFFKASYKLLATAFGVRRKEGTTLLWTMDRFRKLCTSVYNSLSRDETTTCDRTEQDVSHYFERMREHAVGTQSRLIADAIYFHAAHGTAQVRSKRILEEAIDEIDHPIDGRARKRGRFEIRDCATNSQRRTKKMHSKQRSDDVRLATSSGDRDARSYSLRSRRPNLGSFTSSQGSRRSVRLASKGASAVLKCSRRS